MEKDELKKRRENLDLTQKQLAEILDVKTNTVSRWESGNLPKIPKTVALAIEAIEKRKTESERGFFDALLKE